MPSPGSGPSTLPLLPRGAEPRVHSRPDPAAEWPLCPEARAERLLSPPVPSASPRTELLLLVLSGPGTPKEEAAQWGTPGATGHPDSELQAGKRRGSGRPPRCRTGAWGRGAFAEVEGTGSSSRAGGSRQGTELRGREAGSGWRSHRLWDDSGGRDRRGRQNVRSCHPPDVPARKRCHESFWNKYLLGSGSGPIHPSAVTRVANGNPDRGSQGTVCGKVPSRARSLERNPPFPGAHGASRPTRLRWV